MELKKFDNIPLDFQHEGVIIHGVIKGIITDWVFNSNDPVFLKYFPSGKMPRRLSFKSSELDYDTFISSFYLATDKLLIN